MNSIAVNEYLIQYQNGSDPVETSSLLASSEAEARTLSQIQFVNAKILNVEFTGVQQLEMDLFGKMGNY